MERLKAQLGMDILALMVLSIAWTTASIAAGLGYAKTEEDCPVYQQEPLHEYNDIYPEDGVLNTQLTVAMKLYCVPVWDDDNTRWEIKKLNLRTYGVGREGQEVWGTPGPFFYLRKSTEGTHDGTRFNMQLRNRLPAGGDPMQCNEYPGAPADQKTPNCFHGDNVTNFHFHGFHISPQAPQDDVSIKIYPGGKYNYKLDPIPWNQAEGTHWYHAHKHGSTALQVLNGLAGVFIIEGPFDDWLENYYEKRYGKEIKEQILTLQQIEEQLPFASQDARNKKPSKLLVNGQADPIITMRPGEIQRWRFIAATMSDAAAVEVEFQHVQVKQIAMDGVAFAPENYARQPLTRGGNFSLSPGNRADFLVKAPLDLGRYFLSQKGVGKKVVDTAAPEAQAASDPNLFTIQVTGLPRPMEFPEPEDWPKLPKFLHDIPTPPTDNDKTVAYSMDGSAGNKSTKFFINGMQYESGCAAQTVVLNTTEKWTITNDSNPEHPFHIHVNPFQVVKYGRSDIDKDYSPPYVWQDTIALPSGTEESKSSVEIYQRFSNYTGAYVQHCHILGHEDRGMMLNVQTVCPKSGQKLEYGKPIVGGQECIDSPRIDAMPKCEAEKISEATGHR